jgi:hypothetical protein
MSRGRGLTLTRIMLRHHKIFGEDIQKGKEMGRTWEEQCKIRRHHCSALAGSVFFKGDTKQRCAILTLVSLYTK